MTVLRLFLMLFLGAVLFIVVILWAALRPRSYPTDHLTLQTGQTLVVKRTWPVENYQWGGNFRLAEDSPPLPEGPSQIVMRLKNEDPDPLYLNGSGDGKFAPGETKEIFRGTLEEFLRTNLEFLSHDKRDKAHVELQIDATFAQKQPLKIDIRWLYLHYFL